MIATTARRLLRASSRFVPLVLVRARIMQLSEREPPEAALRALLALDDVVRFALDKAAIRYDGGVHAKHRLTAYHDFFVERVRASDRVLDLGCGQGDLSADIAQRTGAQVTGVDWNAESLRLARERHPGLGLDFVEADLTSYDPGEAVDVVVLSNVLEHIDARVELLCRLRETARPDRLLIRVPVLARDWTVALRRELGVAYFSDPTHEIEYDLDLFAEEMAAGGLTVESARVVWGEIWAVVRP